MTTPSFPLTLYVDMACPLCAREVHWLRRRADPQRLMLVDISSDGFDAAALGLSLEQLQDRLHARGADGEWLTGIDATLWSWRAAGVGGWVAPPAWRPVRPLFLLAYKLFSVARPHLAWLPHPDGSQRCKDVCPGEKSDR